MSNGAAAAHTAAVAQAIKASGVLVRVEPEEFEKLLAKAKDPLVVSTTGGVFKPKYEYMVSYRGFVFYTKSLSPLQFPSGAELVSAKSFWMPL
jgi:hypothetical protein